MVAILKAPKEQPTTITAGSNGIVSQFTDQQIGIKLLAMGVLPGSRLQVVRQAPFGGGMIVKVDHNFLALRAEEAACILLK